MFSNRSFKQRTKAVLSFFILLLTPAICLFAAAPSLDLPFEIAKVEKSEPGTNSKTFFFIQEAHVDYNAQKSIAEILKHLVETKSLHLILVEGGWGDTSLAYMRSYGTPEGRREVAERYLKEGKISGEEYLDIVSDLDMEFWGIENSDDYRKNMEAFLKFYGVQERLLAEMQKLETAAAFLEDKTFSTPVKQFETERKAFSENQVSLLDYIRFLKAQVDEKAFDSFSQLKQLMALDGSEQTFDPARAELEKQEIIKILSRTVSQVEFDRISFLKDRKNMEDELELIRALLNLCHLYRAKLPNLNVQNLIRYSKTLENMMQNDVSALYRELKQLEDAAFAALQVSKEEQTLLDFNRSAELIEKLFRLEMTPEDFANIQKTGDRHAFDSSYLPSASDVDFAFINEWVPQAKAFYEMAMKREQALIENSIRKIEESHADQAAILVGGFHTEHMMHIFKERGFSCVLISPRFIPADSKNHSQKYFEILKYKWENSVPLTSNLSQGGITQP